MSATREDQDAPARRPDTRPFTPGELVGLYTKSTLAALIVGLICAVIALHIVYVPVAWIVGVLAAIATFRAVIQCTVVWDTPANTYVHFAVIVALVVATLATSIAGGVVRYNTEAPARQAAAVRLANSPQGRYDAAVKAVQQAFEAQGFSLSDDDPALVLDKPGFSSGHMTVVYGSNTVYLLIKRLPGGAWIAGCPTRVKGVMYPLGAFHSALARILENQEACPAGLDPP